MTDAHVNPRSVENWGLSGQLLEVGAGLGATDGCAVVVGAAVGDSVGGRVYVLLKK
jgi:hypothetical protein